MGPEQIMLFLGLAVILIVVLAAVIGLLSGLKKTLGWFAFLLVLLGLFWIIGGNSDFLLNLTLPESLIDLVSNTLNVSVTSTNLAGISKEIAINFVPNLEDLLVEGSYALSVFMSVVGTVVRAVSLIACTLVVLVLTFAIRLVWIILKYLVLFFAWLIKVIFRIKKKPVLETVKEDVVEDKQVVVTNDISSKINLATVSYSQNPETPKKSKSKKRLWGAGLGIAKAALVLTLIFVPISGLVSIASSVSADSVKTLNGMLFAGEEVEKVEETDTIIDTVYDYIDAYQDSFVGKLMHSSKYFFKQDISSLIFNNLLTVDTPKQTIVLPEEIINYIEIFNAVGPAYQNGTFDIWAYAEEHDAEIRYAFDILKRTKLIQEVIPVAIEYAGTMPEVTKYLTDAGYELNEIIPMLRDINWGQDWQLICDAVYTAIDLGDFTDEDFDYLNMNSTTLKEILTYVGSANFIREIMPVVLGVTLNLDAVKEFTGGQQVDFDLSNVNWAADLSNLADVYETFKELGINDFSNLGLETVEEILNDTEKTQSVLKLLGFVIGVEDGQERADINLFSSVLLPIADVILDQQLKANALEMFEGILSVTFDQFDDAKVKELWYNDLATLIEVAQYAVKINALSMDPAQMDLEDLDSLKGIINGIFDLKLISGNVKYEDTLQDIKSALLSAAIEKFEFLEKGTDWSNINWLDEKDKLIGYTNAEGTYVKGLIDVYGDLLQLGKDLQKEQGLEENPFDLINMKFNFDVLLADEESRFIDLTLSLVEIFIDEPESNLFLSAFPNAVNKYIVPMLEEVDGEFGELPLFDNLTKEEIIAEVDNLLSAIRDVSLLKFTTAKPNLKVKVESIEGEQVYALSDAFTRIINSKLLSYEATSDRDAQDFRGRVIRIILKLATPMDIGAKELDSITIGGPIDYDSDLSKINGLINTILDEVLDEEGILFDILFDEDGNFAIDQERLINYLLDETRADAIVEALEKIFGTYDVDPSVPVETPATLLSAIAPALYHTYLVNAMPQEYVEILNVYHYKENPNGTLSGFSITSDINKLLYVLSQGLEMGLIEFYNGGNFKEGNIEFTDATLANLKNMLYTTTELNILEDNFHDVVKQVLIDSKINVREETLARIDNAAFEDFINHLIKPNGALDETLTTLKLMNITSLVDVKEFIKSDDLVGAIINKATNEILDHVVNVFDEIGSSVIVNAFLPGLLDYAADELLKQDIDITFLKGMSYEYLNNEVVRIGQVLRDVIDLNLLDVYVNKSIENLNRDGFDKLFTDLMALSLVKDLGENWLEFGLEIANTKGNLGLDLTHLDLVNIDFEGDKEKLLVILDNVFVVADELGIKTMDDVNRVKDMFNDVQGNIDALLPEANVDAIYNILKQVAALDTVTRILPVAVQYGMKVAPETVKPILEEMDLLDLTGDQLAADIDNVAEIYITAVKDGNALSYVKDTKNLDNLSLTNFDYLQKIINIVAKLNTNIAGAIPTLLEKAGLNPEGLVISQEEFRSDLGVIANDSGLLARVELIFSRLETDTLGKLKEVEFTVPYLQEKLAIPYLATDIVSVLDFIDQMAMVNKILPSGINFVVEKLQNTIDISFLSGMTYEQLNGEIGRIADVLYDVIYMGALDIFTTGTFEKINETVFSVLAQDIMSVNVFAMHYDNIVKLGLEQADKMLELGVDFTKLDLTNINLQSDIDLFVNTLHEAVALIHELEMTSTDDIEFVMNNMKEHMNYYIRNSVVTIITNIYENLVKADTVTRVLPVAVTYLTNVVPDLSFLSDVTKEQLSEDLIQTVSILRNVVEMDILGVYNLGNMNGNIMLAEKVVNVENIFDILANLNTINLHSVDWMQYAYKMVGNMLGFTPNVDVTSYDFAADMNTIKTIISSAINTLVNDGYVDLNSVRNINLDNIHGLLNDATLETVNNILEKVTDIELVNNLLPNLVAHYADQYLSGYELEHLQSLTKEQIVGDLVSVIDIVQEVLAFPHMAVTIENALSGFYDVDLTVTEILVTAINNIFSLNVIEGHYGEIIHFVLDKLNVPTTGINFDLIDEANDRIQLVSIVRTLQNVLHDAKIITLNQLLTYRDFKALVTDSNFERIYDVINSITSITLLQQALFPAYSSLVLPAFTDANIHTLADLESLYGEEEFFFADLKSIFGIFLEANDFRLHDILNNDGEIVYTHEAIGNIINAIFGLNYLNLNNNTETIINAVSNLFEFNLGGFDLATVSFENDGQKFVDYYYTYFAPILSSAEFPIHRLSDLNPLDSDALINYLSREEIVLQLVDGLQRVFELPTISAAIVIGAVFAIDLVPAPYIDVIKALHIDTLSPDQIGADLTNLAEIILIAINEGTVENGLNIYEALNNLNGYVLPEFGISGLREIFTLLFGLNMLQEPTSELIQSVFNAFLPNIDVSLVDFANTSLGEIGDFLLSAVDHLEVIIDETGVVSIDTAKDYYNKYVVNMDILRQTEVLKNAYAIVKELVYTNTALEFGYPLVNQFLNEMVAPYGIDFGKYESLETPAKVAFNNDLKQVLNLLNNGHEFVFGTEANGNSISYENVDLVNQMIDDLFTINLINLNLDGIMTYVNSLVGTEINGNDINLITDKEVLKAAYKEALVALQSNENPIKKLSDLSGLSINKLAEILSTENAHAILNALDKVVDTTIVAAGIEGARVLIDNVTLPEIVTDILNIIDLDTYVAYTDGVSKVPTDLHTIIDIARSAVTAGAADLVTQYLVNGVNLTDVLYSINIEKYLPTVQKALSEIVTLKALDGEHKLSSIISLFTKDYITVSIDGINWASEVEVINSVLADVVNLTVENELITVSDLMDAANEYGKYITDHNALVAIGIVQKLLTLDTFDVVTLNAYNNLYFNNLDFTDDKSRQILDLEFVYGTNEALIKEVSSVLESLKALVAENVEFGAASVAVDVLSNNYLAPIKSDLSKAVRKVVEALLGTEYVKVNQQNIINLAVEMSGMANYVTTDYVDITLTGDAPALGKLVESLLNTLAETNTYRYANAFVNFDMTNFLDEILVEKHVLNAINALSSIKNTTILRTALRTGIDYANQLISTNIAPELGNLLDPFDYVQSEVSHDFIAILDVVKEAVTSGALEDVRAYLVYGMDINTVINNISVSTYVSTIQKALSTVVDLTRVNDSIIGKVAEYFTNGIISVDLETINYKEEVKVINSVIADAVALGNSNNIKLVSDYMNITNNWQTLINDENVYALINIAQKLLTLETADVVALNVYENLVYNNLEINDDDSRMILNLSGIYQTGSALVDEVSALLENVKPLVSTSVEFGLGDVASDYVNNTATAPIQKDLTKQIANLVAAILDTTYVKETQNSIINLVYKMTGINQYVDTETVIDLNADRLMLAETIEGLLNVITNADNYRYANAYANFNITDLLNEVLTDENANLVVDSLEKSVTTTTFQAIYIMGMQYVSRLISTNYGDMYGDILDGSKLTNAEVAADYKAAFEVVREAITAGIVSEARLYLVDNIDLNAVIDNIIVSKYVDTITVLLNNGIKLNVLQDNKLSELVQTLAKNYITVSLSDIDWAHEVNIITSVLPEIVSLGTTNNLIKVADYKDIPNNWGTLITDPNVLALINVAEKLLDLQILNVAAINVYNNVYFNDLVITDDRSRQILDLEYVYTNSEGLINEVRTLLAAAKSLVAENIEYGAASIAVDYITNNFDAPIKQDFTKAVAEFVEVLLETNYVKVNQEAALELVYEMTGIKNYVNTNVYVNLISDKQMLAKTVEGLLNVLANTNSYRYVSMFRNLDMNLLYEELLTNENVNLAIDALEESTQSTVFRAMYVMGIEYLDKLIGANLGEQYNNILVANELSYEQISNDYKAVFGVIRSAVEQGALTEAKRYLIEQVDVNTIVNSLNVENYLPVVKSALEAAAKLNVLESKISTYVELLAANYITVELDSIDWTKEVAVINDVLTDVVALAVNNAIVTVEDYVNVPNMYGQLITDANVLVAIDIVEKVLGLQLVNLTALDIYNNVYFNDLIINNDQSRQLLDLESLYGTNENLIKELQYVLEASKVMFADSIEFGAASVALDFINGTTDAPLTDKLSSAISQFFVALLDTTYVKANQQAMLDLVYQVLSISDYVDTNIYINLNSDKDRLGKTVEAILNILAGTETYKYAVAYKQFNMDNFLNEILTKENALDAITGLEYSTKTTLLRAIYIMGVEYLGKVADSKVPGLGALIDASELSESPVSADYKSIFSIMRQAINDGAIEPLRLVLVDHIDPSIVIDRIKVEQYLTTVQIALDKAVKLNVLKTLPEIVELLLKDITTADLNVVDFSAEVAIINDALSDVVSLAKANHLIIVKDYKEAANLWNTYLTDRNAYQVINIANKLLTLNTLDYIAIDLYNALVTNKVVSSNEYVARLINIDTVYASSAEFVDEISTVLTAAQATVDENAISFGLASFASDYVNKSNIAVLTTELDSAIAEVVKTILGTKFVAAKQDVLVDYVLDLAKVDSISASDINLDLAHDAQYISRLVNDVMDIVVNDGTYIKLDMIMNIFRNKHDYTNIVKLLLTQENALFLINELQTMTNATFLTEGLRIAAVKAESVFANNEILVDLISTEGMSNAMYIEDVETVLSILESVFTVDAKDDVVKLINNYKHIFDMDLVKYEPVINNTLVSLPTINLVKDNIGVTIKNVMKYMINYHFNIVVTAETLTELNAINYVDEFGIYANVISNLISELTPVIGTNGTLTYRQIDRTIGNLKHDVYPVETVHIFGDIVADTINSLANSKVVYILGIPVYESVQTRVANSYLRSFFALPTDYNRDNFIRDIIKVSEIARNFVYTDAYKAIYTKSYKDLVLSENAATYLSNAIIEASKLEFFSLNTNQKYVELVGLISKATKIEGLDTIKDKYATVDIIADGAKLAAVSEEIVNIYNMLNNRNWNIDLYLLGDSALVQQVINLYEGLVQTESMSHVITLGFNKYLLPKLYDLTVELGRPVESFNKEYSHTSINRLAVKVTDILNNLMAIGVFSNNGVSLANEAKTATRQEIIDIYEIILSEVRFNSKAKQIISNVINNLYLLDNVALDYSGMKYKEEINAVKNLVNMAKPVIENNKAYINHKDLTTLTSLQNEMDIVNLYNAAMDSKLISQLVIPAINAGFFALTNNYVFVLFDVNDGITSVNFVEEVINPVFEALRGVAGAVNIVDNKVSFNAANIQNIKTSIDTLVNTKFINGGTTDNLEEIFRLAVMALTKVKLTDNVVAVTEIDNIKILVDALQQMVESGVYTDKLNSNMLLEQAGLTSVRTLMSAIQNSEAFFELTEFIMDKLAGKVQGEVMDLIYNMVMNATVEELKADTYNISDILTNLINANIFRNGKLVIDSEGTVHLATAVENIFANVNIVDGYEEEVYSLLIKKLDFTSIDPQLDPVQNVKDAIANEAWTWDKEAKALSELIASFKGIIDSGVEITVDGAFVFDNIMNCTDEAALTATLQAFNATRGFRDLTLTVVNKALEEVDTTQIDINSFISESLRTQLDTKQMASVETWHPEMANLAHIFIQYKNIKTDINVMTAADIDLLTEILDVMNESTLFNINGIVAIINEQLTNIVPSGTEINLADTSSWTESMWTTEIVNINAVLKAVIVLDEKSSNGIINASETVLSNLLNSVNESNLVRTILPVVIESSVRTSLESIPEVSYGSGILDSWLTDQTTGVMESKAIWATEVTYLVDLIQALQDETIFNITEATSFEALQNVLLTIRDSKSFHLDFLSSLIENKLSTLISGAKLGTMNGDEDPRWGDASAGEIVNLIAILEQAKLNNAFDASFDVTTLEKANIVNLLQAMNKSIMIRTTLPVLTYNAINDNQPTLVSDWLRTEYNAVVDADAATNMSSVETWAAEIVDLADVIAAVGNMDLTSASFDFATVLHGINDSKSLEIEGIYTLLADVKTELNMSKLGKVLYDTSSDVDKHDKWALEIDYIQTLINNLRTLNIIGSASQDMNVVINTLDKATLTTLLTNLNNSSIFRVALPEKLKDAVTAPEVNASAFLTTWLDSEVNTMSAKEVWTTEIAELAETITVINSNAGIISKITTNTYTDADIIIMKSILSSMNNTNTFTLNGLVPTIQTALDNILPANKDADVSNDITLTAELNKEQWIAELDILLGVYTGSTRTKEGILTVADDFTSITFDTLKTNANVGTMLDLMAESQIFGSKFNAIFRSIIKDTSLYPNVLADKHLTDERIAAATANGWSNEIAILVNAVPSDASQSGAVIDELRKSSLIGNDIDTLLYNVIVEQGLEAYAGTETEFSASVNKVNARIDASLVTPDPADDWSWAKEVDQIMGIATQVRIVENSSSTVPEKTAAIQAIKDSYATFDHENSLVSNLVKKFAELKGITL